MVFEDLLTESERRNTVVTRYMEPGQRWSLHAAPVRRLLADITADGGPAEDPLELEWVNRNTQAQRVGQVRYRQNRRERRAAIMLPARFAAAEEGDWIGWTSDRYHGGGRVVYRVERWSRGPDWTRQLVLREVSADDYAWSAASDEIAPGAKPPPEPEPLGPLTLPVQTFTRVSIKGVAGVRAVWRELEDPEDPESDLTPIDPAIQAVRLEIRRLGQADITPSSTSDVPGGEITATAGVADGLQLEARLRPIGPPQRPGPARAVGAAGAQRPRRPGGGRLGRDHPGSDPGRRTGPHRQCHRPAAGGHGGGDHPARPLGRGAVGAGERRGIGEWSVHGLRRTSAGRNLLAADQLSR